MNDMNDINRLYQAQMENYQADRRKSALLRAARGNNAQHQPVKPARLIRSMNITGRFVALLFLVINLDWLWMREE
jgi:hypothetical protein